ncbi:hypothetical protein [Providencia stuartii]|uniref:hypothetical protein n=1 Tax=Providencia stuartii TaxID=588 RepID=UPI0034E5DE37
MKRILAVAAVVALLAACDSKQDAPFGLKWGQSMESVGFIKDGDCENENNLTTCKFGNKSPFNDWSTENELKFENNKLSQVSTYLNAVSDQNYFCAMLGLEYEYISDHIESNPKFSNAIKDCRQTNLNGSENRELLAENLDSTYGMVSVYLITDPYFGAITYSPKE